MIEAPNHRIPGYLVTGEAKKPSAAITPIPLTTRMAARFRPLIFAEVSACAEFANGNEFVGGRAAPHLAQKRRPDSAEAPH